MAIYLLPKPLSPCKHYIFYCYSSAMLVFCTSLFTLLYKLKGFHHAWTSIIHELEWKLSIHKHVMLYFIQPYTSNKTKAMCCYANLLTVKWVNEQCVTKVILKSSAQET